MTQDRRTLLREWSTVLEGVLDVLEAHPNDSALMEPALEGTSQTAGTCCYVTILTLVHVTWGASPSLPCDADHGSAGNGAPS